MATKTLDLIEFTLRELGLLKPGQTYNRASVPESLKSLKSPGSLSPQQFVDEVRWHHKQLLRARVADA